MPRPWGAGGRCGAGGRPRAPREHRCGGGVERRVNQLWANQMNMRVNAAGGEDAVLAGDHLGARTDHDVDPELDVGVACLADAANAAVANPDIGLDDAPMVEDHRIGDDGIDGAVRAGRLALPHTVADHLAAAELYLLAVDRAVALDLESQSGIG